MNAPYNDESDDEIAVAIDKAHKSSYVNSNLELETDDIMNFYRVKALKDGKMNVSACFDDDNVHYLEIKDGIFV